MPVRTRGHSRRLGAHLSLLTDDLLLNVFSHLDAKNLNAFMHTCKHYQQVASEDVLWRAMLEHEVGEHNLPAISSVPRGCWRSRFWQWHRLESCAMTPSPRVVQDPLSPLPTAPTARFLHRGASSSGGRLGRWLYVFGGRGEASEFNDLWVLDMELAEQQANALAELRGQGNGCSAGSGGTSGILGHWSSASASGSSAGNGTSSSGSVSSRTRGRLLVPASSACGILGSGAIDLPSARSAWQRLEANPAPPQRQSATLTSVGFKLLMFGGRQGEGSILNDTPLPHKPPTPSASSSFSRLPSCFPTSSRSRSPLNRRDHLSQRHVALRHAPRRVAVRARVG